MIKHDLTGQKFGRLTAMRPIDERSKRGYVQWVCRCDCDRHTEFIVSSERLVSGNTRSCGCLQRDVLIARNVASAKYPLEDRESRLYRIWHGMRARTTYSSQSGYENYGGRGVKICDEWNTDFLSFRDWAVQNGYSDDLTIDRIDTNGDYSPLNCRWSTRKEQNNNQRDNVRLTYDGKTYTAAQWAEIMGISKTCIYKRISRGHDIGSILKEYIDRR